MKKIALLLISLFLSCFLYSQSPIITPDSLVARLNRQLVLYPQEKIYLHTDKPYYMAGENIWLRAYLADAQSNRPNTSSKYVYIELVAPSDSVVTRIKLKQQQGAFAGNIPLYNQLPEGNYTLCAYTNYMGKNKEGDFYKKKIFISSVYSPLIQLKTEFKEEEDKISLKVSLTDIRKQEKILPERLYYRMGNGKLKKALFRADSTVTLEIEPKKEGDLLYIQANNYKKYITLPSQDKGTHIAFFPEGGYLVEGKKCRVAFKALGPDGRARQVKGTVADDLDNQITTFESLHAGMGTFYITPQKGRTYHAIYTDKQGITRSLQLPEQSDKAKVLATNWSGKRFVVSVLAAKELQQEDSLYLLIHARGNILYAAKWENEKDFLAFERKQLPSGLIQAILIDKWGNTLSQRVTFCLNPDQATASLKTDQEEYKERERVKVRVQVNDSSSLPLKGDFSVAVTDDKEVKTDIESNILTTLLLTADLKGYIEQPAYYFQKNNRKAAQALEALMMTQGWKRYDIPKVLKAEYSQPQEELEIGQQISGRVKPFFKKKPAEGVQVSILSTNVMYANITQTDKQGEFRFNGFDFPDSTKYVIQAFTPKGGDRIEIQIDPEPFAQVRKNIPQYSTNEKVTDQMPQAYLEKTAKGFKYSQGMRSVLLDEVLVTARKKQKAKTVYENIAAKSFSAQEIHESKANNIEELLRRAPGVRIINGQVYLSQLRAIFAVDGIIIEPFKEPGKELPDLVQPGGPSLINNGTDESLRKIREMNSSVNYDFTGFDYNSIPIQDIERIDVIKSWNSVIFGYRGGGGVIMITTKRGNYTPKKTEIPLNVARIMPFSYQEPAEFYSPKYETAEQKENPAPDLRTTIYWNPDVKINGQGQAEFEFYTADSPSTYTLTMEGITQDGKIIRKVYTIQRQ